MQKKRTQNVLKLALSLLCLLIGLGTVAKAQEGSDIWIGKLDIDKKQPIRDLIRVTDTDGYTNQPYFFNNTQLYYTQMHSEEDKLQTDIHVFDLALGQDLNLSQSAESEYSPTPIPGRQAMSVIRVNLAGKQELWELNLQGKAIRHLVPHVEPVGYQVWLSNDSLLLFVLGEPHTLQKVIVAEQTGEPVVENAIEKADKANVIDSYIGASLYRYMQGPWYLYSKNYTAIPSEQVSKDPVLSQIEQGNWLYAYNAETGKVRRVVELPENSEYFALTPSGYVITSDGAQILTQAIINDEDKLKPFDKWRTIKISESQCGSGVSRMAVSGDGSMIALVCPR